MRIQGGTVQKPPVMRRLVTLALAMSSAVSALGTPAGTVIANVASLEYVQEDGKPGTSSTPMVQTTVAAVCSPSVLPNGTLAAPGQIASLLPGENTIFKYTIVNTGNASNTFTLRVAKDPSSQFSPTSVLYRDSNNNGIIDAGEAPITQINLSADESAVLLVKADTASSARGSAFINLIAACPATSTGAGTEDGDNVAQIKLGDPPALALTKSFSPAVIKPNEETTVNIVGKNTGGTSREVVVTDFLNTADMRTFTFVSGSARATSSLNSAAAIEYSNDGSTWTTTEPASVIAVRLRKASTAPSETVGLTFKLRAPASDIGLRTNTASLSSGTTTIEADADVEVKYAPKIAIGPASNPEANPGGEMSSSDVQTKAASAVNQLVCFNHTVKNLGDRPDTISTSAAVTKGAATIEFRDVNGATLAQPYAVSLQPGATQDFQACYTPTSEGAAPEALKVLLTSKSSVGAADNKTVDVISSVGPAFIAPVKTGDKGTGLVKSGDTITYTLNFTNNQSYPLNNVVITDPLDTINRACVTQSSIGSKGAGSISTTPTPANRASSTKIGVQEVARGVMEYVSSDPAGQQEGNNVVWRVATMTPGQSVTFKLVLKVPANTPDCATINNVFNAKSDEITTPQVSNAVSNTVFEPANLTMSKISSPSTVVIGEEITYILSIKNQSATLDLTDAQMQDTLPEGIEYVAGSSTLDGAPITPTVTGRTYSWNVPGLARGAVAKVSFRALVTPNAPANLRNNAIAKAVANGQLTAPTSPVSAVNKIEPLSFGPNNADVVGYVFYDRNRNGIYDYTVDVPYPSARIVMANGRIATTDKEGRYHFRNVPEGEWALRLDPNSVAQDSLSMPQDAGLNGSRLVYIRNLTSVDFPLAPDSGDIAVIRDTTLRMKGGPVDAQNSLSVRKQVFTTTKNPSLYTVQLTLSASAPLNAFTLTDPLPKGATLVNGQNVIQINPLPGGERVLTYQFQWIGDAKGATTDPTATWRY